MGRYSKQTKMQVRLMIPNRRGCNLNCVKACS